MHNPGFADRLKTSLIDAGYVRPDGNPDVMRWCKEQRGYIPQYVYRYLKGQEPNYANLVRLADDLCVSLRWLAAGNSDVALTEEQIADRLDNAVEVITLFAEPAGVFRKGGNVFAVNAAARDLFFGWNFHKARTDRATDQHLHYRNGALVPEDQHPSCRAERGKFHGLELLMQMPGRTILVEAAGVPVRLHGQVIGSIVSWQLTAKGPAARAQLRERAVLALRARERARR